LREAYRRRPCCVDLGGGGHRPFLKPISLVREGLASGRLVHLLRDFMPTTHPMHILYEPGGRITPQPRSFVDFAVAKFG
jgi:DNA-binding transcriptional LysR family regulator